jgi:predicted ABC-type ATPase
MSPDDVTRSALAAGREVLTLTRKYLAEGLSFAVETTLAGNGPVETMRRARDQGFQVTLIYVCLDTPDRNVRRVKERVIQGGHAVPGDDIRRLYERSLENLPEAVRLAHTAVLLDNTAQTHNRVLEAADGKVVWLAQNPPAWVKPIVAALS